MEREKTDTGGKVWKDTAMLSLAVALKSKTGRSFKEKGVKVTRSNLEYFVPEPSTHRNAIKEFEREGFALLAESRLGLSIRGPKKLISEFFAADIEVHRMATRRHGKLYKARAPRAHLKVPERLAHLIDRVIFDPYPLPLESATPPSVGYYHLDVPGDIADLMGASQLHPCGYDGSGIRLCMVDDGFYPHPYYAAQGYDVTLIPVAATDMPTGRGHGTAIASNALAVAPGVEFYFVNMYDADENSVLLAAFRKAKEQNPDVITCSWGIKCPSLYEDLQDLEWEIADAVNNGTVVCFACGNGGAVYFPGCMDEVISVGGVFPEEGGGFHASTYASSGECSVNPGRQCPDVCGLVGDEPAGVLIMMPTVPGGEYDGNFVDEDGTAADDGWLCASGTSSAAPQVAGAAALLLQCDPSLTPDDVKAILENTATDVTAGNSASGEAAGAGVDLATGHGLVDVVAAFAAAGCQCSQCGWTCETSCTTQLQTTCRPYLEVTCGHMCEVSRVACTAAVMTGCHAAAMVDPGGCGPASLIASEFPWDIRERFERGGYLDPIARERIARMSGAEYVRMRKAALAATNVHTRRLTATQRAVPGGQRVPFRGTPPPPPPGCNIFVEAENYEAVPIECRVPCAREGWVSCEMLCEAYCITRREGPSATVCTQSTVVVCRDVCEHACTTSCTVDYDACPTICQYKVQTFPCSSQRVIGGCGPVSLIADGGRGLLPRSRAAKNAARLPRAGTGPASRLGNVAPLRYQRRRPGGTRPCSACEITRLQRPFCYTACEGYCQVTSE